MTDAQAHDLYLAVGWEDPGNEPYPSPTLAEEVRRILAAPTEQVAAEVIRWWGCWGSELELMEDIRKCRALGGVSPADIVDRLRLTGISICREAADEIERLRGKG